MIAHFFLKSAQKFLDVLEKSSQKFLDVLRSSSIPFNYSVSV